MKSKNLPLGETTDVGHHLLERPNHVQPLNIQYQGWTMMTLLLLLIVVAALPSTIAFSAAPVGVGVGVYNRQDTLTHRPSSLNMISNTFGSNPALSNYSASALFEDQTTNSMASVLENQQRNINNRNINNNNKNMARVEDALDALLDEDQMNCVQSGLVEVCHIDNAVPEKLDSNLLESVLSSYIGPRVILALVAILYGTNFPLGALMADNLPASAATSSRMVLASLVLSPFLLQLKPTLQKQVLVGGAFVSLGYISQSIALVDTSPALVSFLGSATVLVCPLLQWALDKKPMGFKDAPQTWLVCVIYGLI